MRFEHWCSSRLVPMAIAVSLMTTIPPPCAAKVEVPEGMVDCTSAPAMKNFFQGLSGKSFPEAGVLPDGGLVATATASPVPDAILTVSNVALFGDDIPDKDANGVQGAAKKSQIDKVAATNAKCNASHDIVVVLRVAALNTSGRPGFVIQNAGVRCGLYATGVEDLAADLGKKHLKVSSLNFRFFFERIPRGQEGLSFVSTGVQGDPASDFIIQGAANTDHFVTGAELGGCVTRFNE